MTPELKQQWILALRSGEIKQATGVLKDSEGRMCCLGVLRHVVDPNDETGNLKVNPNDVEGVMPSETQRIAWGISEKVCQALAEENDERMNFEQIAKVIECWNGTDLTLDHCIEEIWAVWGEPS